MYTRVTRFVHATPRTKPVQIYVSNRKSIAFDLVT